MQHHGDQQEQAPYERQKRGAKIEVNDPFSKDQSWCDVKAPNMFNIRTIEKH